MHVRYTARRKLGLLASAKRIMEEEGVSLRQAAERLQVSHSRHNELANEAQHCCLGRLGNDTDEGGRGDRPQCVVKNGV